MGEDTCLLASLLGFITQKVRKGQEKTEFVQSGICVPSGNSTHAASWGQLDVLRGLSTPRPKALTGYVSTRLFFPFPLRLSLWCACGSRHGRTDKPATHTSHMRLMHPGSLHCHSASGTHSATSRSLRS